MHKTTLALGQLLRSVHMEKKLPWQGRLPGVVQRVTHLSRFPRRKDKFM